MNPEWLPVLFALSSNQQMILLVLGLSLSVPIILGTSGIWAGAWARVHQLQIESALKHQMIERGMTADEIVQVVAGRRSEPAGVEAPCASEVVVEHDDEWHTALILKHEGDRYYVHFVGTDMSDNEWVASDRVRFPARNDILGGSALDAAFTGASFRMTPWCGKANHGKPASVDREI